VKIQAGIGRFFAAKLRSGVLYRIYEQTGAPEALDESLKKYREARAEWAGIVETAKPVYKADITVGETPHLRGHWADRLAAIDADIALLAKQARPSGSVDAAVIRAALSRPKRNSVACSHRPAATFRPGQPLNLELSAAAPVTARVYYRHVSQAERYRTAEMEGKDGTYRVTIPGEYTNSPYPLEYYFELRQGSSSAWLYPGFSPDLNNQPYFVVRRG